ncbi:MAG: hypothetical protein PHC28_13445 [Flavobacterium sp.]|uniref:phosphatase domain-containing protein n=1 Tax=Flavobacterium sp. TaxID=239 RepID=UPI002618D45F|nr:hypothetical protein [Flavobacterium sp.]MDD5151457.1 hypothetical protein [Flavobacterium sp.]
MKKDAIIVDIDGTIAHGHNHRTPYEFHKVHLDDPDPHLILITETFNQVGNDVLFVTGRSDICEDLTRKWLDDKVDIGEYKLFMRGQYDRRCDTIVKREIYENHIQPYYNVQLVLDDRPKVIRMYLELGLKVLATGNPYKEF